MCLIVVTASWKTAVAAAAAASVALATHPAMTDPGMGAAVPCCMLGAAVPRCMLGAVATPNQAVPGQLGRQHGHGTKEASLSSASPLPGVKCWCCCQLLLLHAAGPRQQPCLGLQPIHALLVTVAGPLGCTRLWGGSQQLTLDRREQQPVNPADVCSGPGTSPVAAQVLHLHYCCCCWCGIGIHPVSCCQRPQGPVEPQICQERTSMAGLLQPQQHHDVAALLPATCRHPTPQSAMLVPPCWRIDTAAAADWLGALPRQQPCVPCQAQPTLCEWFPPLQSAARTSGCFESDTAAHRTTSMSAVRMLTAAALPAGGVPARGQVDMHRGTVVRSRSARARFAKMHIAVHGVECSCHSRASPSCSCGTYHVLTGEA
jgi:hypothetical protein